MQGDVRCLRRELEECNALLNSFPQGTATWRVAAMKRRLERIADRLAKELWEISKLIEAIDDPELRLIFELRYFRGYTWPEVSAHLPTILSADGARMKHDRYLKKNNKGKNAAEKPHFH